MKLLILRVQMAILRSTLYFSAAYNSRYLIALLNHKLELYQAKLEVLYHWKPPIH